MYQALTEIGLLSNSQQARLSGSQCPMSDKRTTCPSDDGLQTEFCGLARIEIGYCLSGKSSGISG